MKFIHRLKAHQLQLIERIAETGKLKTAADIQHVSQPAASRILAEIEAGVGAALFERTPKGMMPTQIGDAFLRHARSILSAFENLGAEVAALGMGQTGQVRIGSVTGPALKNLVPAILKIKQESPEIEPTLEVSPSSALLRALDQGYFDFIIARMTSDYDSRDFHMLPARSETVSLVVRNAHPLVGRSDLTLEQIAGFEWTIQERGSPIRDALEGAFADAGVVMPKFITNTSSLLVTLGLLEKSDTIATLVEEVAHLLTRGSQQDQLHVLPLRNVIKVAPYYIIRKKNRQMPQTAERVLTEVLRVL